MFEELMKVVKVGSAVRVFKGAVSIALNIEDIEVYVEEGCTEVEMNLTGDNSVRVFSSDNITKQDKPYMVGGKYRWCYRIVDEEDGVFYITDK